MLRRGPGVKLLRLKQSLTVVYLIFLQLMLYATEIYPYRLTILVETSCE